MNTNPASHILPTQSPLTRFAPRYIKGVQSTILAGCLFFALLSPATAADFSGNLKGVTITDAQATNKPPTVVSTYSINGDNSITFNASGSSDPDGTITSYKWIFADGTTKEGSVVTYLPGAQSGSSVTLVLTDNNRAVSLSYINYNPSSEWVGNDVNGSIFMGNTIEYTYYHKLTATPTVSGTLTGYKFTLGTSGIAGRTFNVCLYTHDSSINRPGTLISGSCTGSQEYIGHSEGTDLEMTPLGSVAVTAGTNYWIGIVTMEYATIMGSASSQEYYSYMYGPHVTYNASLERVHTGTAGKLQIEVTP